MHILVSGCQLAGLLDILECTFPVAQPDALEKRITEHASHSSSRPSASQPLCGPIIAG